MHDGLSASYASVSKTNIGQTIEKELCRELLGASMSVTTF